MPSPRQLPNGQVAHYHDNSVHGDDAFVSRDLGPFLALDAVLDGATGHGGKYASSLVANALRAAQLGTVQELLEIVETLNHTLFQQGRGSFLLTTLLAALKIDATLHVVSVGDSPGFLIRAEEIVPLTAAATGPTLSGIAKAMGRQARLACTTRVVTLQPHDRLVLITDGVLDNVSPAELAALVRGAASPQEATSRLRELLHEKKRGNRGREDDRSGFRADDATAAIRYFEPGEGAGGALSG
jgi:serine/threonine protein phosphatase PrpC